jgi:hypothetical protein
MYVGIVTGWGYRVRIPYGMLVGVVNWEKHGKK